MVLKRDLRYCRPTGMFRWLVSKTLTRRSRIRLRQMRRRLQQVAVRHLQEFCTKERKQVGTYTLDGVFGVPKRLPVGPADTEVPSLKSSSGLVHDDIFAKAIVFCEWRKQVGTCSSEGVSGVPQQLPVGPAKAKQLFTEGRKQVGTCSLDGVSGVPKQLPLGPADMVVPCQKSSSGLVLDNTSAVFKQDGTCFEEEEDEEEEV
eukprot:212797-Amphidinium_carterae.1